MQYEWRILERRITFEIIRLAKFFNEKEVWWREIDHCSYTFMILNARYDANNTPEITYMTSSAAVPRKIF